MFIDVGMEEDPRELSPVIAAGPNLPALADTAQHCVGIVHLKHKADF